MSVRKRGKSYLVTVYFGKKRIYETYASEKKAKAREKELLEMKRLGYAPSPINEELHKNLKVKSTTVAQAIKEFVEIGQAQKKPSTIKNENGYLKAFYEYLYDVRKIGYVDQITTRDLQAYQVALMNQGLKGSTINRRFNTYRKFFSTLIDWEYLQKNPMDRVKRMDEESEERETWTFEEYQLLFNSSPEWLKNVLHTLYATGLRPGQVCELDGGSVDLYRQVLHSSSSKGGKTRAHVLPLQEGFLDFLSNHIRENRIQENDPLFINEKGQRVTPNAIGKAVRKIRKELRLRDGLVPYGLRHTVGTELLKQGVNIKAVSRLLGHSRVTTTERYTHLDVDYLREAQEARIIPIRKGS